jgi:Amt family ammonium transporter|tara:strand:- start:10670 stop:11908 length:1239 start_codon:yes stop_codon:yes gene_type:complete
MGFIFSFALLVLFFPGTCFAAGIDSGDTAWILTSTALVLMMTIPGLFLFYGGLVRRKNVLSTFMHSFSAAAVISIVWVVVGYSLAFDSSQGNQLIGSLSHFGLQGITGSPNGTIPDYLFVAFQGTFAIITIALVTGAIAERAKFSAYIAFAILWSTLVYSPLCYWVWGGGWIGALGALDFAGGTVVHLSSGTAALVAAIMYGKRRNRSTTPHNVPFVVIGAALLWVGWFGFNAGSALGANSDSALAFLNTNTAAASAVIAWMLTEYFSKGVPTVVGAASGAIAGLVAITPAAGFVDPLSSIMIGLIAGSLCCFACSLKNKFNYDDTLDVVGIHGIGGLWGCIATGIFASAAYQFDGLIMVQIKSALATMLFVSVGTFIILFIVNQVFGLRVDDESEAKGLDLSEHSESAYTD